ncbi:MAG: hypothetical protein ACLQAH_09620 [Limisphaerales bacterium]
MAIIILATRLLAQSNAPARLALIAETDEASAAADVLTARLSGNPQIQLLERNEIEKVYREQGLAAANQDYPKLGQLLGADGLLILHLTKGTDSRKLSIRLVAVKPGVTLRQREYPWPLDNQIEWAEVVVSEFQTLFPKLVVLVKDALPISILNLRSAVASVQGETVERELTQLLYARLVNEQDLFVLERRRLELLDEENQRNDSTEGNFWNGSYLLEGIIDKAGYQKDTVTIEVRLTPPDKKEILNVEISGARTNLPAVVNDLAVKILAVLKKEGGSVEWNPRAESDRYFTEGQWMLKWGMFQEAKSAGDAAWALGKQNRETAELRIEAYQAAAGDPGICMIDNEEKRVVFGRPINPNVNDFVQIAAYAGAPRPEQFADMVRAEELFLDAFRSYAVVDPKLDPAWLGLGGAVLDRTSLWLRYYYFIAEARPGQEARIETAKRLCLEITRTMETHPDVVNTDTNHTLLVAKARHLAFWVDTPEQCLPVYHALIETGQWPLVRQRFFNAAYAEVSPQLGHRGFNNETISDGMGRFDFSHSQKLPANLANPSLAGWIWTDRERCPIVWNSFIDELCGSAQPLISLEGRFLRCSYSWSEADFEQNLKQLLDYVRQQRDTIVASNLDGALLDDLHILVKGRAETLTKDRRARVQDQLWPEFEKVFAGLKQHYGNPEERQVRLATLEKQKSYLNSQTNFDFMSFAETLLHGDYRPEEARELLPLVTNYEARIKSNPPVDNGNRAVLMRYKMEQQLASNWIAHLKENLNNTALLPPQTKVPSPATVAKRVVSAPQVPMSNATTAPTLTNISTPPLTGTLEVGRFWKIPTPDGIQTTDWGNGSYGSIYNGTDYVPQITSCCYRDGKLWVEARYDQTGDRGRADFFSVDLKTFAADKVQFEGEEFTLPNLFYLNRRTHSFEVQAGFLYLSVGHAIKRYSFKDHSWEQFPVPAAGKIIPARLGDRLFFASSSSILEYTSDGTFRTLASSRRRPPASLLDNIEDYGAPHLFLGSDDLLQVRMGNDVYAFSTNTSDWQHIATLSYVDEQNYCPSDDGFVAWCGPYVELWGMARHSSAPEFLFWQTSASSQNRQDRSKNKDAPLPRWRTLAPGADLCLQDDNLWFLIGSPKFQSDAAHNLRIQETDGLTASLIRFTPDAKKPITIPLRFKTDNITLRSAAARELANPSIAPWRPKWNLQWTPQGLVLIYNLLPGFWFVPKTDLEQAVERVYSQQRLEAASLDAVHAQWRKELLATYDLNHDGIFGPGEREAMIDDPRYLELELPVIDANTNGLLDAEELGFFDANTNEVLEPREQKAIETTLSLLAGKLMAKLTPDADGRIDPADLPAELIQPSDSSTTARPGFSRSGTRIRKKISKEELVSLLRSHLGQDLRIGNKLVIPALPPEARADGDALFKARIEAYWKLSKGQTKPEPSQR